MWYRPRSGTIPREEGAMALQEKLDAMREMSKTRIPPEARAIMDEYVNHRATCPSCLESEADSCLMDATWWREEADRDPAPYPNGTRRTPEQAAAELEAEAAGLRLEAAKIRDARGTSHE